MGEFETRLSEITNAYGSNEALAKIVGIDASTISKLKSQDAKLPRPATLVKLCNKLPEEHAARLLAAFLRDQIPSENRNLVEVTERRGLAEDPPNYGAEINKLSPRVRSAVERLIVLCMHDKDIASHIVQSVRLWDRDWAKLQDTKLCHDIAASVAREKPPQ